MRFTYSYRKMAKLFANSGDPDQMPHSAASDLGLHCLPSTFYGSPDYNGLMKKFRKCHNGRSQRHKLWLFRTAI